MLKITYSKRLGRNREGSPSGTRAVGAAFTIALKPPTEEGRTDTEHRWLKIRFGTYFQFMFKVL